MATNGAPPTARADTGEEPAGLTTATPNSPVETFDDPEADVPSRKLTGRTATLATVLAAGLSCYALYWVVGIVQPQIYRVSFLLITLVLTFLVFPAGGSA